MTRSERREKSPRGRSLWAERYQREDFRVHRCRQATGGVKGSIICFVGPAGGGKDEHRQKRRPCAQTAVLPLFCRRDAGRGGDQRASADLHRRDAGQNDPGA